MSKLNDQALALHREHHGKIEMHSKVPLQKAKDLTLAYSPGVAAPCLEIQKDYNKIYDYTNKGNTVAVVTNGSAVLGLGNIGAGAGLPVMEGKSILFKGFAGVDSVPICLDTQDVDEIVRAVELMAPTFGGINLEDISAPRCFEIERKLKEKCDIPIFHDDQHGTAVVTLAAMLNASSRSRSSSSTAQVPLAKPSRTSFTAWAAATSSSATAWVPSTRAARKT